VGFKLILLRTIFINSDANRLPFPMSVVPEEKRRRRSLVAGEARKDRFKHTREGTGRVVTARPVDAFSSARKTGLMDLHQLFSFTPGKGEDEFDLEYATMSEAGTPASTRSFRTRTSDVFSTPASQSTDEDEDVSGFHLRDISGKSNANDRRRSSLRGRQSIDSDFDMKHTENVPTPSPVKKSVKSKKPAAKAAKPAKKVVAKPAPLSTRTPSQPKQKRAAKPQRKQQQLSSQEIEDVELDDVPSEVSNDDTDVSFAVPTPRNQHPNAWSKDQWRYKTPALTTERTMQKYKNNTGGLIAEAKDTGFLDAITQAAPAAGGLRRSTRQRWAPLDEWRNQRIIYTRDVEGAGAVMPTATAVISPSKFDNVFERKRAKRARKAVKKAEKLMEKEQRKLKKQKRDTEDEKEQQSDSEQDLEDFAVDQDTESDEEVARVPLTPACPVHNPSTNKTQVAVVAKTQKMVSLEPLASVHQEGPKMNPKRLAYGGKMFEEEGFSSGVLSLPPQAVKHFEMAHQSEIFYVAQCSTNGLELRIHRSKMKLSQGDSFTVPPSNVYYLKNLSTKPVLLYFVLVKHPVPAAEDSDDEE